MEYSAPATYGGNSAFQVGLAHLNPASRQRPRGWAPVSANFVPEAVRGQYGTPHALLTFTERLGLALFHRLCPEALFMVLTAYLDESGTHGRESPTVIVAGFIADSSQWAEYERRMAEHFQHYDVDVYHAKKLRQTKGPFRGWKIDKKEQFHTQMHEIVDQTLAYGLSSVLKSEDYRSLYLNADLPRKTRRDSQYALCFRLCMYFAGKYAQERGDTVHFVLESGHRNSRDAVRVFDEFKTRTNAYSPGHLGTISFDKKGECLPLAAADMFAHIAFRAETEPNPEELESDETYLLGQGVDEALGQPSGIHYVKIPATPETINLVLEQHRLHSER